ncbi:pilus assembly protein PilZ [Afipia sp. P52-10]|jgi:hypothetical protein|uniref:PilZ domain-containing protein n=1 Tax=Afipia sp. P52-10 TaxID=1429916 RepID=UPI0003DF436A|nr:PilZ domain-containing protein [Afipia sp. P52-10]ETR78833.1 pilus assembly protein PilZ [Afipia sp. P52-10]
MLFGKKKRDSRKSMQRPAWVVLDGSFASRPCIVLDLSETGAKLQVEDLAPAHTTLRLTFSRDVRSGRLCEVAWRRGKTVGVRFI